MRSIQERDEKQLQLAFDLVGELGLGLKLADEAARSQAGSDAWWHSRVLAFGPELRQIRRSLLALVAAAGSAGQPLPLAAKLSTGNLSKADQDSQLALTVELFSLLGLTSSGAESQRLATALRAEAKSFLSKLQSSLFQVDQLRLQLWSKLRERAGLQALLKEAQPGWRRVQAAWDFEVLPPQALGRSQALLAMLREELDDLDLEIRKLGSKLARLAGLAADRVLPLQQSLLLGKEPVLSPKAPAALRPEQLLQRVPELQAKRWRYGLAEAELRQEVAAQWPRLRLGPSFRFRPDGILTGGALALELPWPGSRSGVIAAAVQRREAAREALEDALLGQVHEIRRARADLDSALQRKSTLLVERMQGSEQAWRSTRAQLWVKGGPVAVKEWLEALSGRKAALRSFAAAERRVLLAELRLRELLGARPGIQREGER